MEKSESIGLLAKALATFQATVPAVKKDASNPFFKSKYASLGNIIDTIKEPLAEAGLSYSQIPDGDEGLTTILMHAESGEYLTATYNIHAKAKDPQGIGSAITYARRYALSAILGLNTDDDDDGNAAQGNGQQQQQQAPPPPKKQTLSDDRFDKLIELVNNGDLAAADKAIQKFDLTQIQKDTLSKSYLNQSQPAQS